MSGGGSVTGAPAGGCLVEFAASNQVFSPADAVVVPFEDITLAATGWLPDSTVDFVLEYAPTGQSVPGTFPTDAAGEYYEVFSANEDGEGAWILTANETGTGCEAEGSFRVVPLYDILDSQFLTHIKWLFVEGITAGCSSTAYCPNGVVTRGQMATFLVRALNLPPTSTDFFTDDEGSVHEANINRLRAAGITAGCGGTRFCPNGQVTRGQMATFMVRAFNLPTTSTDYFNDDQGSVHEPNINRMRAANITAGCGGSRFCPSGLVTRGQMAAFLDRAVN
jgi:2-keto-3-deoxy-6-phosphogluconate aldolase